MRLEIIQTPGINALKKTLSFPGEAIAVFMASGDGRKYAEWADAYAAGYRLVELNDDTDGRMEKRISALERQLDASRLAAMEWRARFEEASAMLAAANPAAVLELIERAERAERLFNAACSDLGLISEHLKLDPNDGGCDPIIGAIEDLEGQNAAMLTALEELLAVAIGPVGGSRFERAANMAREIIAIAKYKEKL